MERTESVVDLRALSRTLKVLAEPKRLEILALLLEGTQCNCELGGRLAMAPNLISHHLKVLHEAGWITMERDSADARWIYYTIQPEAASAFLGELAQFLDTSHALDRSPNCGPSAERLRREEA